MALSKEAIHNPHNQAEHKAQDDARRNGKEDSRILAAIIDVARQTPERNAGTSSNENAQANHDQQPANANEQLAEGTHPSILSRMIRLTAVVL